MILSEDAYLKHYGVKGMKWGVRKEKKTSGRKKTSNKLDQETSKNNKSKAAYLDVLNKEKPPSKTQRAKNLQSSEEKSLKKLGIDPKDDKGDGRGFPTKKHLVIIGVGAAVVGGGILAYKYRDLIQAPKPGQPVSHLKYKSLVQNSKYNIWGGKGYVTKESFEIPPMEFDKGHTFFRLTTSVETSFRSATYATHSPDDFNRYVSSFAQELGNDKVGFRSGQTMIGMNRVTFRALEKVRVPTLEERLDTVREVMKLGDDREAAIQIYNGWSGGSWTGLYQQSFFDSLKAKGFDAIVDDMDAGVLGETPLVIFSPEKFSKKEVLPLTVKDVKDARKNLTELANRRPPT